MKGKKLPVGTIREWKGRKFKKIREGRWTQVYEGESRGKNISKGKIFSQIRNAKDVATLVNIIRNNREKFSDDKGNVDPVVKEFLKQAKDVREKISPKGKKVESKQESPESLIDKNSSRVNLFHIINPVNTLDGYKKVKDKLESIIKEFDPNENNKKQIFTDALKYVDEKIDKLKSQTWKNQEQKTEDSRIQDLKEGKGELKESDLDEGQKEHLSKLTEGKGYGIDYIKKEIRYSEKDLEQFADKEELSDKEIRHRNSIRRKINFYKLAQKVAEREKQEQKKETKKEAQKEKESPTPKQEPDKVIKESDLSDNQKSVLKFYEKDPSKTIQERIDDAKNEIEMYEKKGKLNKEDKRQLEIYKDRLPAYSVLKEKAIEREKQVEKEKQDLVDKEKKIAESLPDKYKFKDKKEMYKIHPILKKNDPSRYFMIGVMVYKDAVAVSDGRSMYIGEKEKGLNQDHEYIINENGVTISDPDDRNKRLPDYSKTIPNDNETTKEIKFNRDAIIKELDSIVKEFKGKDETYARTLVSIKDGNLVFKGYDKTKDDFKYGEHTLIDAKQLRDTLKSAKAMNGLEDSTIKITNVGEQRKAIKFEGKNSKMLLMPLQDNR